MPRFALRVALGTRAELATPRDRCVRCNLIDFPNIRGARTGEGIALDDVVDDGVDAALEAALVVVDERDHVRRHRPARKGA